MLYRPFFIGLLTLLLWACQPRTAPLIATQDANVAISSSSTEADKQMAEFIQPFRDSLANQMNRVVTVLPQVLTHSRNNPHTRMGPWLCDILLQEGKEVFPSIPIDGALYNPGGIRSPRLGDTVTVGNIFEILPFDNTLVLLEIKGELLQKWVDHTISRGGWPLSRGLKVYVSEKGGNQILLHNQPIKEKSTFRILTNDYVANGGDNCAFLKGTKVAESKRMIREIVIHHFDKGNAPSIPQEPRLYFMDQN